MSWLSNHAGYAVVSVEKTNCFKFSVTTIATNNVAKNEVMNNFNCSFFGRDKLQNLIYSDVRIIVSEKWPIFIGNLKLYMNRAGVMV